MYKRQAYTASRIEMLLLFQEDFDGAVEAYTASWIEIVFRLPHPDALLSKPIRLRGLKLLFQSNS